MRGSNVTIGCSFKYPAKQVKQVLWCSMISNHAGCINKPYDFDSDDANNNQRNFQYIGDKASNCSLLISNINQTHSGEYTFRFITKMPDDQWTGDPGVKISVCGKYKRFILEKKLLDAFVVAVLFSKKIPQFHYGLFLLFSDRFKGVNDQIERQWKHNSRRLFKSDMHTRLL